MILSRTMQPQDLDELRLELSFVDQVAQVCGGWRSEQHPCRRWEYALAYRALGEWMAEQFPGQLLRIADVGPATGLWAPMMFALGHDVVLYEPWVYGDQTAVVDQQMSAVRSHYTLTRGWSLTGRPLCELEAVDKGIYHAAFCISTLEHIGEEERAFADLLSMVRVGGLVFLTMDFAGDADDRPYELSWMRCRMYTPEGMGRLMQQALASGFSVFGGTPVWGWAEDCRRVNNYGFASLCLWRVR